MKSKLSSRARAILAGLLLTVSASTSLAQVNTVRFKGAYDGHSSSAVQGGTLTVNESGAGTASHIGRFTITAKATVDLATGLGNGILQFVVANGDVLNASFVSRAEGTDEASIDSVTFLGKIIGGTGRFQGATGTFTMNWFDDETSLPTPSTSAMFTGTISIPVPAK